MSARCDDLEELRDGLLGEIEDVAATLLGKPNPTVSTRRTLRWGGKGSLALEIGGAKRGLWYSYELGRGSDPLGLVQVALGCSFADAVRWARVRTGVFPSASDTARSRVLGNEAREARRATHAAAEAAAAIERVGKVAEARRIAAEAVPLEETLGERYLVETRGIPRPAAGWPQALRWHAGLRSVVAVATDATDRLCAVQRVRIGLDGRKANDGWPVKLSRGFLDHAYVRLPGSRTGPLQLAEGIETGLTAWAASGSETWIALGNMAKVAPPPGRLLVACADDDARHSPAAKALRAAASRWRRAGCDVAIATPWPERRYDKSDLNDLARAAGIAAVRGRIERAFAPSPEVAPPRLSIDLARLETRRAITRFAAAALAASIDGSPAPVHVIRADVGVGKSGAALDYAARLLTRLRKRRSGRIVAFAVPTHALGDELAAKFHALPLAQAMGLTAAVWRGRNAPDPEGTEPPPATMCLDLPAVALALDAGARVQDAVCSARIGKGRDTRVVQCRFFDHCGYQRQQSRRPDLWIVPHELPFAQKPAAIGELAALIVDEGIWRAGIEATQPGDDEDDPAARFVVPLDALDKAAVIPGQPLETARLMFLRRRAADVLRGLSDGPVLRDGFDGELTDASASEASGLEWRRHADPKMVPAMSLDERKLAASAVRENRMVRRLGQFWQALKALLADGGPAASGWLSLATDDDGVRVLRLQRRRPIRAGWQAPTLILDAITDIELLRPYWPTVKLIADIRATTPHMTVRQVADRAFSKSMLAPFRPKNSEADPAEARRCARNLRKLRATLIQLARRYAPGRVLIVIQKGSKEALCAIGPLPPNVELAHHNAVAGQDGWRDVVAEIVVGRCLPRLSAVERIAEALTGTAVEHAGQWSRRDALRLMTDGTAKAAEADRHPHPVAEAVRWQICEGELTQIVGRCRGVNRSADNPVDVWLLCDVPLPLPIDATFSAADLEPTPADLMVAEGGIALENARHAATAYPALWSSHKAAGLAFLRSRTHSIPNKGFSIGERVSPRADHIGLDPVEYQLAGAGAKPCRAWVDPSLSDPKATLEAMLGPLKQCERAPLDDLTPRDPPAPPVRAPPSDPAALPAASRISEPHLGPAQVAFVLAGWMPAAARAEPAAAFRNPHVHLARPPGSLERWTPCWPGAA